MIADDSSFLQPSACSTVTQRAALIDLTSIPNALTNNLGWGGDETDPCLWPGLACSEDEGLVTHIKLPSSNLTGSLDELLFNNPNFTLVFGCSLSVINLRNNDLSGSIPVSITSLYSLERLSLASNDLSGTIPENLSSLTALEALDLSSNHLTGTLPLSLCNSSNPLSDLLVNSNQLQGTIDVSSCVNLFYLDCSRNQFNGTVMGPPAENNRLHAAYITDNQITNFTDFISSGLLTDLVLDRNPIPDDSLLPQLTVLQALHSFSVVNQDFDAPNYLSGTLPASVLTLGSLRSINLKSQAVYGSLPAINGALDLTQLSLSFNCVSGTIPASVARVLSARSSILDLRFNFLSCCAVGPLDISDWTVTNVSYNSYDLSLPRLPRGIKFSSTLQPVTQPLVAPLLAPKSILPIVLILASTAPIC